MHAIAGIRLDVLELEMPPQQAASGYGSRDVDRDSVAANTSAMKETGTLREPVSSAKRA